MVIIVIAISYFIIIDFVIVVIMTTEKGNEFNKSIDDPEFVKK